MPAAKHTPGPWSLGMKAGGNQHVVGPRTMPNGKRYTTVPGVVMAYVPISGPEDSANAALIAAAPALADALDALYDELDRRYDGAEDSGTRWMGHHIAEIQKALRAAGRLP